MPKPAPADNEHADPTAEPKRKPWSPPRVIESEADSTEAGVANVPEGSGGVLS